MQQVKDKHTRRVQGDAKPVMMVVTVVRVMILAGRWERRGWWRTRGGGTAGTI